MKLHEKHQHLLIFKIFGYTIQFDQCRIYAKDSIEKPNQKSWSILNNPFLTEYAYLFPINNVKPGEKMKYLIKDKSMRLIKYQRKKSKPKSKLKVADVSENTTENTVLSDENTINQISSSEQNVKNTQNLISEKKEKKSLNFEEKSIQSQVKSNVFVDSSNLESSKKVQNSNLTKNMIDETNQTSIKENLLNNSQVDIKKDQSSEFFKSNEHKIQLSEKVVKTCEIDKTIGITQCPICFTDEMSEKSRILVCDHYFCTVCLLEWIQIENRCPICKTKFNEIEMDKKNDFSETIQVQNREQVYKPIETSEDRIIHNADEFCYACNKNGDKYYLLICDLCLTKCCHTFCLNPKLDYIPQDEWFCDYCVFEKGITHKNPIAKILQKKSKEVLLHPKKKEKVSYEKISLSEFFDHDERKQLSAQSQNKSKRNVKSTQNELRKFFY